MKCEKRIIEDVHTSGEKLAEGISDQKQEQVDSISWLVYIAGIPTETHCSLSHLSVQRSEPTGFH